MQNKRSIRPLYLSRLLSRHIPKHLPVSQGDFLLAAQMLRAAGEELLTIVILIVFVQMFINDDNM